MLSPDEISRLAERLQTSPATAAREYAQHVFLSFLYQDAASDALLFKGGTALRLAYGSPRFSEDLDFSGSGSAFAVSKLLDRTASKARQEIRTLGLAESKATTGGYLGIIRGNVGEATIEILIQVSFRRSALQGELLTVSPAYIPQYTVWALHEKRIVEEKVDALLSRAKPRDFYDLYFIIRKPLGDRRMVASKRAAILERVERMDSKLVFRELRSYLPRSHWEMGRHLREALLKELRRL